MTGSIGISDDSEQLETQRKRVIKQLESLGIIPTTASNTQNYNIGASNYAQHIVQPWHIWQIYALNPWDADIVKRVLRNKPNERRLDYEKIMHICQERIRQIDEVEDYIDPYG